MIVGASFLPMISQMRGWGVQLRDSTRLRPLDSVVAPVGLSQSAAKLPWTDGITNAALLSVYQEECQRIFTPLASHFTMDRFRLDCGILNIGGHGMLWTK